MTYYYLQNAEYLRKVIQQDKSVPPEVARVFDQILQVQMGFDAEALEGNDEHDDYDISAQTQRQWWWWGQK